MGTGSRRINGETGEIIMLCYIYIYIHILVDSTGIPRCPRATR